MATIALGDTSLYYRETGSGAPLLLIHGTGAHADTFDAVVPLLVERHRVIVYDRRGYSRSGSRPAAIKGYLKRQADDAAALLRGVGAVPATVVGWSMGGLVGLCLALEHPEVVSRLIVCEPPLHVMKHLPLRKSGPFLRAAFLAAIGRKRAAAAAFFRTTLALPKGGNAYDALDPALRDALLSNLDTTLHEMKTGTGEELTPERLSRLRCPVSAIIGNETLDLFVDATARLATMLPAVPVHRAPGAGHLFPVTHPKDFARFVLQD